jgi:hypothetical protein
MATCRCSWTCVTRNADGRSCRPRPPARPKAHPRSPRGTRWSTTPVSQVSRASTGSPRIPNPRMLGQRSSSTGKPRLSLMSSAWKPGVQVGPMSPDEARHVADERVPGVVQSWNERADDWRHPWDFRKSTSTPATRVGAAWPTPSSAAVRDELFGGDWWRWLRYPVSSPKACTFQGTQPLHGRT